MNDKKKKYKHIQAEGFKYDYYQDDDHIFDYMPIWELNNKLIFSDPAIIITQDVADDPNKPEKKPKSGEDTRVTWLVDELLLSSFGASSALRLITDHLIVLFLPILFWHFSLHIPLVLYIVNYCEILFADEEQEADMLKFRKDDWIYEGELDLRDYHMYNAMYDFTRFDLRGNTIIGYGEPWGVQPTEYSASMDYWFDTNKDTIMLIQEISGLLVDMEEVFDDANSEMSTLYSPDQERYSKNTDELAENLSWNKACSKVSFKGQDINYSYYNFYDLIYHIEKDSYNKKGKALNKKIVDVITDRFKWNLKSILYTDGVRDYDYLLILRFLKTTVLWT